MRTILTIYYDDRMWSIALSYGFGLIKGSTFSTIPSGYSMNIITPYGFNIGPFIIIFLLHLAFSEQTTGTLLLMRLVF